MSSWAASQPWFEARHYRPATSTSFRAPDNLERLAHALRRLNAKIRTDGEPVTAPLDGPFPANVPPDAEPCHRVR